MDILDKLVPERPKMPKVSKLLHNSANYNACIVSIGLIVQSNRTGLGTMLANDHPQYADYVDAIENAIDKSEADALCRALIQ